MISQGKSTKTEKTIRKIKVCSFHFSKKFVAKIARKAKLKNSYFYKKTPDFIKKVLNIHEIAAHIAAKHRENPIETG